jgi:sulfonate transport system substrate-binding protein
VSILTEGTISATAEGLDVTIMQVYVSSPLEWGVFVPASSDLTSEDELAGRPIAISRHGSGSHLIVYILAEAKGWALPEDQFVVTGGLEGARQSFAAGESEVFLWDRFMTRPLVDAGEFRQLGTFPTPWPSFVIAARTEVLTGRTVEVGRLVDTVVAEATALHARSSVVEEIMARYGLDAETTKGWLASTTFAPRQPMDPDLGESVLAALKRAGFVSE